MAPLSSLFDSRTVTGNPYSIKTKLTCEILEKIKQEKTRIQQITKFFTFISKSNLIQV